MTLISSQIGQLAHQSPFLTLAVVAMEAIQSYVPCDWKITARPSGPYPEGERLRYEIQLFLRQEGMPSPAPLMKLDFYSDSVHIPRVVLPFELHHQGIIIRTHGQLTAAANEIGYTVIVEDLVESYKRSLLRRGAHRIQNVGDAVILHTGMNFEPSSPPQRT